MYNNKMRVKSDRLNEVKEEYSKMGIPDMSSVEMKPVDMYGKCVFSSKGDPKNLEHAGEDIKEFYDLEGTAGLKGE